MRRVNFSVFPLPAFLRFGTSAPGGAPQELPQLNNTGLTMSRPTIATQLALLSCLLVGLLMLACDNDDAETAQANRAPVLADRQLLLDEQTAETVDFLGSDPDGDSLSYHLLQAPAHGTLVGNVLQPDSGFTGDDAFLLRAWDGQDSSRTALFSITVRPVNALESAVIIGESMALLTGGALEALDAVARLDLLPQPPQQPGKGSRVATESFDPDSCIWDLGAHRDHLSEPEDSSGFSFEEAWRVWLRDEASECLQYADSTLRWMDMRRDFNGSGWNGTFTGQRDGHDSFHLTEFNAGLPGILVNGRHERRGDGMLLRRDQWVEHEFELELEFEDVRMVPVGDRLLPVSGQVSLDLRTRRDAVDVRRRAVIEFTTPGEGGIRFDDGDEWIMNIFTGSVNPAQ
ncbi:MAG: hypothetical protein KC488_11075 [Candidatus Cloacimonetes bacterium]|nr:hypothetical protein [Candidatus Cloacimonadota bacterium]